MLQLSFEFAATNPVAPERNEPERPLDELDRAYARASDWSAALASRLGQRVRLVVTDNRSTMLSARPKDGRLEVRVHHMFLTAGEDVLDAVGRYLSDGSAPASRKIDRFIEEHCTTYVSEKLPERLLRPMGRHYDLNAIRDDLALRHFGGDIDVRITWGKRVRPKRGQRSLQLGTYVPEETLIRIHPVLDQAWVPRFFVEAVVFHEMLHHDMPAVVHNGRHNFHTAAFRKREKAFEYHDAALRWENENLWRLLRGTPNVGR